MRYMLFLIAAAPAMGFILSMALAGDNLHATALANHVLWIALLWSTASYLICWYMRSMRWTKTLTALTFAFMVPVGTLATHVCVGMPWVKSASHNELMSMLGVLAAICCALLVFAGELANISRKELRARRRRLLAHPA